MRNFNKKNLKYLFLIPIVLVVFFSFYSQIGKFERINSFKNNDEYLPVINWFKENNISGKVILANEKISDLIPLTTSNYVVFSYYTGFHIMSDKEVEERYLLSHVFINLTKEDLKKDFRHYVGAGNAVHEANVLNRNTKWCLKAKIVFKSISCPELVTPVSLRGEEYFDNLLSRFMYIQNHKNIFFDLYHVDYVVLDKEDKSFISNLIKGQKVEIDGRFLIYKI